MAIEFPKESLRALVATLAELSASRVYWAGEPERHIGPIGGRAGKITLNPTALAENGTIEPRRTWTETPTPSLTTEWGKQEIVTVSFLADNFLRRGEAYDTLRSVRFKLALPSSRAILNAAGLAYVDSPLIIPRDYVVDNRDVSRANMDVRFAHVVSDSPASDANEGWIEKVSSTNPPDPAAAPPYDLTFTRIP